MATIFAESFETSGNGTRYTTSILEFTDGLADFFTRTDGSNITGSYSVTGVDGSFFFAAQDINGEGAASQQTLTFSGIDIVGATNLSFSALFAEDDSSDGDEDWDLPDFVLVEYQIDGGGFQNLLAIESVPDGDSFNAVPAIDTDFDGEGDGAEITSVFAEYGGAIVGTGSSLDLRFTFDLDSGDEDIAIDRIQVMGDEAITADVLNETFDDASQFSTSTSFFSDGAGDYFTLTDGSNIGSFVNLTGFDGQFLAAQDLDGEGGSASVEVLWSGLDISGLLNLEFSGLFAEDDSSDGNEDWDSTDFVKFEYSIDGGAFQNLLAFENDGSTFNSAPSQDTDFDGNGDGPVLTSEAQEFKAAISGTGNSLDLRLTIALNSADEDIAIDSLRIAEADVTGTTLAIASTDADKAEGDAGTTPFTFTVTRSGDTSGPTSVNFTVTSTEADVADFGGSLPTGTVNFAANETSQLVTINVSGDTDVEPSEAFTVTLSDPTNGATITTASANGTIQDDDTPAEVTPIYAIQGDGDDFTDEFYRSPLEGQEVVTVGIVTATGFVGGDTGFFIQDASGDGNNNTSDGIFVASSISVAIGDEVQVAGTVIEEFEQTEIDSVTQVTVLSSGNSITPIVLGVDRVAPTEIVDDAGSTDYDVTRDGRDFYESIEGMLVTLPNAISVDITNRFDEFYAISSQGNPTGVNARGGITISEDTSSNNPIGADLNPERIQIDTDLATVSAPAVEVGDRVGNITGVINYDFNDYAISPIAPVSVIQPASNDPETTNLVGTSDQLTVATFNVLNLDPGDPASKFNALGAQITDNLGVPDIIGLQEIQDNNGPTNNGVTAADQTLQELVDAIANASGPTYSFIDNTFIIDGQSGGQPGGNIRTAFLYNPNRVTIDVDSVGAIDENGNFTTSPINFFNSRVPLVADFTFAGETVTVINNHFSSKGGSDPLFGDIQPPANGSLDEREAQATAVNNFVSSELASDPDANIVALGDFNEFQFFTPLEILEQNLTNLTETLPETERYTFNFEGNSQALDHILVTNDLVDAAEYDTVHINSEFADAPSDHDPAVARLTISGVDDAPVIDRMNDYTIFSQEANGKEFIVNLIDGEPVYTIDGVEIAVQSPNGVLSELAAVLGGEITRNGRINEGALEHFGDNPNPSIRQSNSDVIISGSGVSGRYVADFDNAAAATAFKDFADDLLGRDPALTEFFEFRGGTNGGANTIQIFANDEVIGLNNTVKQGLATQDSLLFRWSGANVSGRQTTNNQDAFFEEMGPLFGGTQIKDGQVTGFGNQTQAKLAGDNTNQVDFGSRGIGGKEVWEFANQQEAQNFLDFFNSVVDSFATTFS